MIVRETAYRNSRMDSLAGTRLSPKLAEQTALPGDATGLRDAVGIFFVRLTGNGEIIAAVQFFADDAGAKRVPG